MFHVTWNRARLEIYLTLYGEVIKTWPVLMGSTADFDEDPRGFAYEFVAARFNEMFKLVEELKST